MELKTFCFNYTNHELPYKYIYAEIPSDKSKHIVIQIYSNTLYKCGDIYTDNTHGMGIYKTDIRTKCFSCKHGLKMILGKCKRQAKFEEFK